MKDYSKEEIDEAVSGEKAQYSNLRKRILKWTLIINDLHEILVEADNKLKYLYEQFDIFYEALNKIGEDHESLEGQKRK